jgi:micrococcal nuclease
MKASRHWKWLLGIALVLLVVFAVVGKRANPEPKVDGHGAWIEVTRVVDGDTIVVGDGAEKIRLKCIDTPETKDTHKPVQCYGPEASNFTTESLLGKHIRLEFDPKDARIHYQDFFGRTLAYVFLEDGTLFNLELAQQGYGRTMSRYPCSRKDEFKQAEAEAQAAKRGLWGACPTS